MCRAARKPVRVTAVRRYPARDKAWFYSLTMYARRWRCGRYLLFRIGSKPEPHPLWPAATPQNEEAPLVCWWNELERLKRDSRVGWQLSPEL